jgi:hypothetical protein
MSANEKERLYQTELIKSGVRRLDAVRAAKILAADQYHNTLSEEDQQILDESCRRWFKYRQLMNQISKILSSRANLN